MSLAEDKSRRTRGRHNTVEMMGVVLGEPEPVVNAWTGKLEFRFAIATMRDRHRWVDDKNNINTQKIEIVVYKRDLMGTVVGLKRWDFIQLSGVLCSMPMIGEIECDVCHYTNERSMLDVFVVPINLAKRGNIQEASGLETEHDLRDEALRLLTLNSGFTNKVSVVGTLHTDPKLRTAASGAVEAQYQIRVGRRYHIRAQDAQIHADFPTVKCYGEDAQVDFDRLHAGSYILVNGYVSDAYPYKRCQCDNCQTKFKYVRAILEIVPFTVDYLDNFYTPEEVQERKAKGLISQQAAAFRESSFENIDEPDEDDAHVRQNDADVFNEED